MWFLGLPPCVCLNCHLFVCCYMQFEICIFSNFLKYRVNSACLVTLSSRALYIDICIAENSTLFDFLL